ncbi:hypothetical protein C7C46_30410 [Streptomyces tateyamensis]|uniref:Uncharacterized protein n=1 Tax=Streptomyces tateyamensis TaxID=565073 RepID=A0A2V4NTU5_9ACTN|nr:hypothetical protein [Streptomyces tateyamensis]PYC67361.1 hypothetical protein C7C46_30410 [Streptomyces tateyamensis]
MVDQAACATKAHINIEHLLQRGVREYRVTWPVVLRDSWPGLGIWMLIAIALGICLKPLPVVGLFVLIFWLALVLALFLIRSTTGHTLKCSTLAAFERVSAVTTHM